MDDTAALGNAINNLLNDTAALGNAINNLLDDTAALGNTINNILSEIVEFYSRHNLMFYSFNKTNAFARKDLLVENLDIRSLFLELSLTTFPSSFTYCRIACLISQPYVKS